MTKQDKPTSNQGWGQIVTPLAANNRELEINTWQKVVISLNAKSEKQIKEE